MIDREKVIKGLRCLSNPYILDMDERDCENCKYDNASCFLDVTADAFSLLKAQEPIPCGEKIKAGDIMLDFYECGYCKNAIRKPWKYCPFCGKAVKWEW